jgi:hypothetical protein
MVGINDINPYIDNNPTTWQQQKEHYFVHLSPLELLEGV